MQTLSVGLSLVAILIAAGLGWLGTAAARSVALRTGIVNAPNPIVPDHVRPVPYLGGIGIALGVFGALLLTPSLAPLLVPGVSIPPPATGLLVGAVLFLGVGLADDLLAFGASRKIVLQFASAGVALALGGLTPAIVGLPPVDALIAALWIVSVVNAVNFIDVSDGLAGTLAATSATLFALTIGGDPLTALAVTGAGIGFLVWNRPPARIFMGDAGSLFLGFLLAGFGLTARVDTTWWPFLPLLALLLVVPLFDLVFQTTTRMIEGRPWFIGGPDSYALRLQRAGLSKAMVASVTALVTVAAWAAGWLLLRLETGGQVVLLVVATVLALIARQWLLRFHVERRADGPARLAGVQEGPTADRPSLPVPEVVDVR